jgi:hypothetical protein
MPALARQEMQLITTAQAARSVLREFRIKSSGPAHLASPGTGVVRRIDKPHGDRLLILSAVLDSISAPRREMIRDPPGRTVFVVQTREPIHPKT